MREKTLEPVKKFEDDSVISVRAIETLTCGIVYVRAPWSPATGTHHPGYGVPCVTGPDEVASALILRSPFTPDTFSVKFRGPMESRDDFVKTAFNGIPADRNAAKKRQEEGCRTICG